MGQHSDREQDQGLASITNFSHLLVDAATSPCIEKLPAGTDDTLKIAYRFKVLYRDRFEAKWLR
jgi:hypothetical protein